MQASTAAQATKSHTQTSVFTEKLPNSTVSAEIMWIAPSPASRRVCRPASSALRRTVQRRRPPPPPSPDKRPCAAIVAGAASHRARRARTSQSQKMGRSTSSMRNSATDPSHQLRVDQMRLSVTKRSLGRRNPHRTLVSRPERSKSEGGIGHTCAQATHTLQETEIHAHTSGKQAKCVWSTQPTQNTRRNDEWTRSRPDACPLVRAVVSLCSPSSVQRSSRKQTATRAASVSRPPFPSRQHVEGLRPVLPGHEFQRQFHSHVSLWRWCAALHLAPVKAVVWAHSTRQYTFLRARPCTVCRCPRC